MPTPPKSSGTPPLGAGSTLPIASAGAAVGCAILLFFVLPDYKLMYIPIKIKNQAKNINRPIARWNIMYKY
jgi:hypothetical protein